MKLSSEDAGRRPLPALHARPLLFQPTRSIIAPGGEGRSEPAGRGIRFAGRTLIFMQGDEADSIYELIDGTVMLYRLMPDGRRQIVELLGPGDVFGLAAASIHDCSAESLVAGHCLAFKRGDLDRSPALLQRLSARMQMQLCAMHDHAVLLGRKTAMERIASFLLRCVPKRGGHACLGPRSGIDDANIRLRMTRQEIADFLGLTIETVSRCLSKLRRRDAISIDRLDEIVIHDVCRMCRLTGTEAVCER
jgi:CRP/FNR family transcriptional regulator